LEEWQRERYHSEQFQVELETPTAKCTGEVGVKIHEQLQQDFIHRQNPENCRSGRFLLWRLGKGGFGQEVRKLAYQLAIAYAENRTLVIDTSVPWKYTDAALCPEQSFYCYFEQITKCTLDDVLAVHEKTGSQGPIPTWSEDNVDVPVVFGNYNTTKWRYFTPPDYSTLLSLEWFRSELLYYLLQPNEYTQNVVREEKKKLGLPEALEKIPYIAMHIRGGDKHTEYRLHPFREYLNKAKWFKTLYGVKNIFLVSDDAMAISQATTNSEGFNILWSSNDREEGGSQEATEVGHLVMLKVLKDIFIASQCQFWIGTLSSNFGDTIWELMVARNAGTIPPYVSLDIPWTTHNQPNVFV
jgi:hypothetical protein